MEELKGMEYLKYKLEQKRTRNQTRYDYYEMKNRQEDFNITMPERFSWLKESLGWCAKAVDTLADRLNFREFTDDTFGMNEIYNMNNADLLFDSAILSALITSCSFIYISEGDNGYPRLQVIDGRNATGIIDPTTNLLVEGYAVLQRDYMGNPTVEAYFTKGATYYYRDGKHDYTYTHKAPYALLVPIVFRPDPKRPFGHSRITRACMSIQQSAMRTLKRSEVSAEFYSFPQKYVLGMDADAEPLDRWKATISSMLQIS